MTEVIVQLTKSDYSGAVQPQFFSLDHRRRHKGLDGGSEKFVQRKLEECCSFLILDAHYKRVREEGVIRT